MREVIPLSERPLDKLCIVVFASFLAIALFVDALNAVGQEGGITPENSKDAVWPPRFMWDLLWMWGPIDPLLVQNPLWLKIGCAVSAVLYTPFYVLAIYAFIYGKEWIKTPTLLWCGSLIFTLLLLIGCNFWGQTIPTNVPLWIAAYGMYLAFPLYLVWRFRTPYVFSRKKSKKN